MKYVKITSCHVCLNCRPVINDKMMCYHNEDTHHELGEITMHFVNKTIHPDCPLDDYEEQDKYAQFGKQLWDWFKGHYGDQEFVFDEDGEHVMEIAKKYGMAKRVKYNEEIHGHLSECDEGDMIWWWG
jgi:hypothetical protein